MCAGWAYGQAQHRRAATSLTHASLTVPTICDQWSDEEPGWGRGPTPRAS